MVGWESRDLEERMEINKLSVRWGMYEFKAWRGGALLDVRIVVIVWRSCGWEIAAEGGGFMFSLRVQQE